MCRLNTITKCNKLNLRLQNLSNFKSIISNLIILRCIRCHFIAKKKIIESFTSSSVEIILFTTGMPCYAFKSANVHALRHLTRYVLVLVFATSNYNLMERCQIQLTSMIQSHRSRSTQYLGPLNSIINDRHSLSRNSLLI